jgi:hypothetical protein
MWVGLKEGVGMYVYYNVPVRLLGTRFKQNISFLNLVPRSLKGIFLKRAVVEITS